MKQRFLRRLSVRQRVFGGLMLLVVFLFLSIPALIIQRNTMQSTLAQLLDVRARADRLLLSASVRIQLSRVDLMRYTQELFAAPYEALDEVNRAHEALEDVNQAQALLEETAPLLTEPEMQEELTRLRDALEDYEALINDILAARTAEGDVSATQLELDAQSLGQDIGVLIEGLVDRNQMRQAEAAAAFRSRADRRLNLILLGYFVVLALGVVVGWLVQRSITEPLAQLREGAETFSQGKMDVTIPVTGTDELSVLAETFNRMSTQISQSYLELEERVARRTRDLERRSEYLRAAAEVGQVTNEILDLDELLPRSVELIRRRFNLYYVGLFLVDEAGKWAVLRAGTGEAGGAMLARGHRIRVGEGMIGWSVKNAHARVAEDVGGDAVRLATAELPDTRSEAAIPLRARGSVIGALTVQDSRPQAFDEAALSILQIVADQLAVTIRNIRLFAATEEALEAERRAYGEVTQAAWAEFSRQQQGYICGADRAPVPAAGSWRPDMVAAQRRGAMVQVDEMTLALPIQARDESIGVVYLRKQPEDGEWDARELALMSTLVERLGAALESAHLYEDTQRRAARERVVGEVTSRMRETLDMESVMQTAAQEIQKALGLDRLVVRLGKPEETDGE